MRISDWSSDVCSSDLGRKQQGITFLLIDMKTPGITVRPIETIDGGRDANEVFFDDVRVPVENRIGEEGKGWDYAKHLLGNESSGIARIGLSQERLAPLRPLTAALFDSRSLTSPQSDGREGAGEGKRV